MLRGEHRLCVLAHGSPAVSFLLSTSPVPLARDSALVPGYGKTWPLAMTSPHACRPTPFAASRGDGSVVAPGGSTPFAASRDDETVAISWWPRATFTVAWGRAEGVAPGRRTSHKPHAVSVLYIRPALRQPYRLRDVLGVTNLGRRSVSRWRVTARCPRLR